MCTRSISILLFWTLCGVTRAGAPTASEAFSRLEDVYNLLDSYEFEYQVTQTVKYAGNKTETARMLWRSAPGRFYYEPLSTPAHDPGSLSPYLFRTVRSVTATEERVLLLRTASAFVRNGDYTYVAYTKRPVRMKSIGSGLDDLLNPATLMLPSSDILKSREHEAVLEGPIDLGNGRKKYRMSQYRVRSQGVLTSLGGTPVLHVVVEVGRWRDEGFIPLRKVMDLWLDPAVGWMPRERLE